MTRLSDLLDRVPAPEFPEYFNEQDRQMVLLALSSAKQLIRPYDGKFEAPWLLSPFEATVWETTNRGREELVDGKWHNTIRLNWHIALPNGASLTDTRYERLLTLAKKIQFLTRCGLISGASAPTPWKIGTSQLISVIRWVALHEEKFLPEQYGLRLLDQSSIDWLFGLIAEGGWAHALQLPQRLISAIYTGTHGVTCPQSLLDNPYTIPRTEIGTLVQWLECQNAYSNVRSGTHQGKRHLRREALARLISENYSFLVGPNISRFIRQFEPDFSNEALLIRLSQSTEFPSQKAASLKDAGGAEASVIKVASAIASALDAHHHFPESLPEPANISLRRALSIAKHVARPSAHTLFMPVNTGLAYLNTAIRFVHVYGEAIVGMYLAVRADFNPKKRVRNVSLNKSLKWHMADWCIISGEPIASILNITEFRREKGKPEFDRLRSNPTLDEALRVLIGSCIVCMALLKPSREEELTHLKRSCLREDAGGYWINFNLGKSNAGEAWQDADRPIPVISARAIHLLQRLGEGLSTLLAEDRKIGDNLFYLPQFDGMAVLGASDSLLNEHLDIFCDFVGLPPDGEGRRWYVRIHEMRKWFLLLLFWSGRFDVLDAMRWIAGHTDAEHVYAYIEKEFPGEELPRLEAEYSIDRMYRREQERKLRNDDANCEDGVDALYEAVLRHFNVEFLTMVPESEWAGYVLALRKDEKFRLEPHSIFGENGRDVVGINVSFVIRQVT